ncbi:hypothetical protein ACFRIB_53470 [Streptomyces mirabilis]|uniref:hypothetical protein n=1 Tax=Streptomyces mirabilis TaxID=68239 RepID=UPI0036C411E5
MLPRQGAAWLNGEAFEYFRYLRDEPVAGLVVTFVGGEGCRTVLRREPMLVLPHLHVAALHPPHLSEALAAIPPFHPIRADTDPTTSPPPTRTPRTVFLTQRVCPA